MPFFQTMLVTLLTLSSILANASPVVPRNLTATTTVAAWTKAIYPSHANLTTTIYSSYANLTTTIGKNITSVTATGTSTVTNVPQPSASVASDNYNNSNDNRTAVPGPQQEHKKPGNDPNRLTQMDDPLDDITAEEDRPKGDKSVVPQPKDDKFDEEKVQEKKSREEKAEKDKAEKERAKHTCAAHTEQALRNWRDQCDHFFAKFDTDCWNRAPRMDRCCDLPNGKKPYKTCDEFLDRKFHPGGV